MKALSSFLWSGNTGREDRNPSVVTEYRMLGGAGGVESILVHCMNSRAEGTVSVGGTGALADPKRSVLPLRLHRVPVGERSGEWFVGRRGRVRREVGAFVLSY